ncbi:MAG TPA: vWA domain-containing protein [Candidatus Nanoarchaeia archaeon]|nr:vWA domain-containing protein [Candidatus Nanoarchaeia archaeon]
MNTTEILRWAYAHMEYPWALAFVIIFIPLLFWFLRKEFLVLKEPIEVKMQKGKIRKLMYLTRTLLIILLLGAIAAPYVQRQTVIDGDAFIELLIDNSTSMTLFQDVSESLANNLEKKTTTEVKVIGSGTTSNIGDSVLSSIKPHGSILLLSDGNANTGADLGDVALFAAKLNATVNAIRLTPIHDDASVQIIGPAKTLENAENTFTVLINRVGNVKAVNVQVTLDGEVVYEKVTLESAVSITRKLPQGNHRLTAKISLTDYFLNNNVFYKTVRAVAKPKIILFTEKSTPLETLLKQLYIVDPMTSIPGDLSQYYSIVVNDIAAAKLESSTDVLNDYIADGNGMVVFGGGNSYENGGYRNSVFESLLPVLVGTPEKKPGDIALAIVVDVSGSQGAPFGKFENTAQFSKAATLDIMKNVELDTPVALVAFNTQSYLLSEPTPVFSKQNVEELVGRLKWGGGTNIAAGLLKAIQVLGTVSGSKNIVLMSDGKTQNEAAAYEAARYAANSGIKIYTVGVGPTTNEKVMMDIAELTNGIYFRATDESRLKILFGPVDETQAKSGKMELVVLNKNHFITENYEPNATLYGFNQVSPKGAGRLLATTSTGEPILTVWRLGLGRVASLSTDDGSKWAGNLLAGGNSRIISRTVNWAIGDPERKSETFVDAKDTRFNEPAIVTIKSKVPPSAADVVFYKIDEDVYTGSVLAKQVGFQQIAGAEFAVNYESEFGDLGINRELESIVSSSGGRMFDADDINGIVDHAKTRAKREVNERQYLRWPLVVLAMAIFLLEIFIRRVIRKE